MTQADAMEFFSHCMQLDSQVAERQRIAAEIQDGFTHRLALVSKKIGKLGRYTGACGYGALNNMETYLRSLKDLLGRAAVTSEDVLSDSQKLTFARTTIIDHPGRVRRAHARQLQQGCGPPSPRFANLCGFVSDWPAQLVTGTYASCAAPSALLESCHCGIFETAASL